MTPIQGDWTISSIDLPNPVLRKIYFDNARKLLARSIPAPVCVAHRVDDAPGLSDLDNRHWAEAANNRMEYSSNDGSARPEIGTLVRALYSKDHLYLRYDSPFTELTAFEPARKTERIGLWDRDVVEAFIGTDAANPRVYYEFEVAPTNEKLDLIISPQIPGIAERFQWNSGFESYTSARERSKTWVTVMKIPLKALRRGPVHSGLEWRINFYRIDRANQGFLGWNPTLTGTFHTPARFGTLRFE
jgi:hypothetical protein